MPDGPSRFPADCARSAGSSQPLLPLLRHFLLASFVRQKQTPSSTPRAVSTRGVGKGHYQRKDISLIGISGCRKTLFALLSRRRPIIVLAFPDKRVEQQGRGIDCRGFAVSGFLNSLAFDAPPAYLLCCPEWGQPVEAGPGLLGSSGLAVLGAARISRN